MTVGPVHPSGIALCGEIRPPSVGAGCPPPSLMDVRLLMQPSAIGDEAGPGLACLCLWRGGTSSVLGKCDLPDYSGNVSVKQWVQTVSAALQSPTSVSWAAKADGAGVAWGACQAAGLEDTGALVNSSEEDRRRREDLAEMCGCLDSHGARVSYTPTGLFSSIYNWCGGAPPDSA